MAYEKPTVVVYEDTNIEVVGYVASYCSAGAGCC